MKDQILFIVSIVSGIITTITSVFALLKEYPVLFYIMLVITVIIVVIIYIKFGRNRTSIELLEQIVILDILDDTGAIVNYTSQKKLKFHSTKTDEYTYSLSTAGEISDVNSSGAEIKGIRKEDGRVLINTRLNKPVKKNDIVDLTLTCVFHSSFTQHEELWTIKRNYHSNGSYKLTIKFPLNRPYKLFKAYKLTGHEKELSTIQPIEKITENHPTLIFNVDKLQMHESYQVIWTW